MKPSEVANYLRIIASKIDKSNKPDRSLVSNDINHIIKKITISNRRENDLKSYPEIKKHLGDLEKKIGTIKEIHNHSDDESNSKMFKMVTSEGLFTVIFDKSFSKIKEIHNEN